MPLGVPGLSGSGRSPGCSWFCCDMIRGIATGTGTGRFEASRSQLELHMLQMSKRAPGRAICSLPVLWVHVRLRPSARSCGSASDYRSIFVFPPACENRRQIARGFSTSSEEPSWPAPVHMSTASNQSMLTLRFCTASRPFARFARCTVAACHLHGRSADLYDSYRTATPLLTVAGPGIDIGLPFAACCSPLVVGASCRV